MTSARQAAEAIGAVDRRPAVKAIWSAWSNDIEPVLSRAIAVQQIPAPTFAESARGDFVAGEMRQAGLEDVTVDAVGNVLGRRPGRSPVLRPVIVSAHLDTVFPDGTDLSVRRVGERLYGPGIGDNSLGVAGLLTLATALEESGLQAEADIWIVTNVGEEGLGDLRGMRAIADRFGGEAVYIVVEGGLFGQLFYRAIGVRRFRITVEAPGGHSWGSFGQASAVHVLGRIIADITDLNVPKRPKTTYNVGVIEGGTTINSIAQSASLQLDLRSESAPVLTELVTAVHDIAARHASSDVVVELQVIGDRPPGAASRRSPLVRLAAAALKASGVRRIAYVSGSTDANVPLSRGWPAVCIGLTRAGNTHRRDEYIETGPLAAGLRQLLLLTLAAAEPSPYKV